MLQFNYSVFDMFRTSKCSSSVRLVHALLWYFFMHPYKQSGRWQDVLDIKHILPSTRLLIPTYEEIP